MVSRSVHRTQKVNSDFKKPLHFLPSIGITWYLFTQCVYILSPSLMAIKFHMDIIYFKLL